MRIESLSTVLTLAAVALALLAGVGVPSANAATLSGVVQTGGTSFIQPLQNVNVTLFEATTGNPNVLGQATSDRRGQFVITSSKETTSSIFFVRADVGGGVAFVTVLGPHLPPTTTLNELNTVAASYSTAQFYKTGVISGNSLGLQLAAAMNDNIVTSATGESSLVLQTSPNADETNSLRTTHSLANLLAACVNNPAVTAQFLALTTPPGGMAPQDTAVAMANLTRNPALNGGAIYLLTMVKSYYLPNLQNAPDAWVVTVKVNDSGNDNDLISGLGLLVFDAQGYAWISNNSVQGTTKSGTFMIVLKPNGKPADGTDGEPVSPVTGGGILGGGYGLTIDPQGSIWEGNFGWGGDNPTRNGNGSVSKFTPSGVPISGPLGYQGGPLRAQGMGADANGNIWIASYGDDSVYVFFGSGSKTSFSTGFQEYAGSSPFGLVLAQDGSAWVSNGGGLNGTLGPNSVTKFVLSNGKIQQQFIDYLGLALKGLAVDSRGNAWVTSQSENTVYEIAPDGTVLDRFYGGGIYGPWGAGVDGDDNVWVSNFGPLEFGNVFTGRMSELCGVNLAACPPGFHTGDPITPPTGYTVPTAGSQVLLHNGEPLYGQFGGPSFIPMMRQTASTIDQAGNIWSLNNWKPDFSIDVCCNPGGDGVVIFVGLATPPATGHNAPVLGGSSTDRLPLRESQAEVSALGRR